MKRLLMCMLVVPVLAAVPALAKDIKQVSPSDTSPQVTIQRPPVTMFFSFGCVVQGTPVEFPDDIVITNKGPGTVPAGTKAKWTLANKTGVVTLPELAKGKTFFVANAFPGGLAAGTPCTAVIQK